MRISMAAIAVVGLVSGPASAQGNQDPASAAPAAEKKKCRAIVATGSIMPKRMCLTRSEWAEFTARNAQDVQRVRDKNHPGTPPPFGHEKGY